MGLEQLPKDDALGLALLDAYQDAYMALKRAWNRLPDHRLSRAERKRTSGAEQNRTTERHVVKHQGPGGVRARFRQ